MKKQMLNLGKALSKNDQKSINGGSRLLYCDPRFCTDDYECRAGECVRK